MSGADPMEVRVRPAYRAAVFLVLAALLPAWLTFPAGCGGGEARIELSTHVMEDRFALYYPVPAATAARVAPYAMSADLSGVAGAAAAPPNREARQALAAHAFVAVPGEYDRIDRAYREMGGAKFVTLDAALFAFHCLGTRIHHNLESDVLVGDLRKLVNGMLEVVLGWYREAKGAVREAALAALAYLGVAADLLDCEADMPPEAACLVEEELALVRGGGEKAVSPLFGTAVDYGRLSPQGRYRSGSEMEGYSRAVAWLGEMGFIMKEGTNPEEVRRGRDMARRAAVLTGALHVAEVDGEPALALWDRIYQVNAFLAGVTADLNPYVLAPIMGGVFGRSFTLRDLENDSAVDELLSRVAGDKRKEVEGGRGEAAGSAPPCFRLLGRCERLEDTVFPALVADEVPGRLLPRGLDIPAALGSDRAAQLLEEVYGEGTEAYREGLAEMRAELAAPATVPSRVDLYGGWQEVLRGVLGPRGGGYPRFMQETAWLDRNLCSFLAFRVELRRDDAQEPGEVAGSAGTENVARAGMGQGEKGYVEPLPDAYGKLAALADVLRRGLRERGLSEPESEERLEALHGLLLTLKSVSEKELRNEIPTAEEYAAIAAVGYTLSFIASLPLHGPEEVPSDRDACACGLSDLYRDPVYGEVLQAATGRPLIYYVVAPVEGRLTLTVGAGFSYYEFVKPVGQSHTLETWEEAVRSGSMPEPPAWTASFLP